MRGKHVLVGVTGGIAAYKVGYLVRDLVKSGAEVKVMMTEAGTRFVAPLTFSALSKNPVFTDLWTNNQSSDSDISTQHIDLANWADVLVIAPASANTIAKLAYGISDNLLAVVALATTRPIILAPTMDAEMYLNPVTQNNLTSLKERGYIIIPPVEGELASGLSGPGRLPEIKIIIETIGKILDQSHQDLKKKRILVTAGPTYEAIDPVRFVGNRSSGKMGFAIANAAAQRGAEVTLVAGPTHLETPRNVTRIDVESAQEMLSAVLAHTKKTDAVIMAAAVADYRPANPAKHKMKKHSSSKALELHLEATTDILATLGKKKRSMTLVGFALETKDELAGAKEKIRKKNLDLIVLNSFGKQNRVFGSNLNTVAMIDKRGKVEQLPIMPKFDIANKILNKIKTLL
ncbi:MAG: bifunctional phosphopantothenoylcysteine decarboxylase/phosphopantothenate--cysteine ligase CoaBC [Bacteroidota bacterium]